MHRSRILTPLFAMASPSLLRGFLVVVISLSALEGCNPFWGDDPYGCNDLSPLKVADRQLPIAFPSQPYEFDFAPSIAQNLTLVDTATASRIGLRSEGKRLVGTPSPHSIGSYSLRWIAWENGTQCDGRSDTFTTYLSIPFVD